MRKEDSMEKKTKPGEKGFGFVLFLFGAVVTALSIPMYQDDPQLSAYGFMPLFLGVLLMILSLIDILQTRRYASELAGIPWKEKVREMARYLAPVDVLVVIGLMLLYCAAMYLGVPFIVATPVYLWASICYLRRKAYLMNLVYTAIVMVFVMVVFRLVFRVILP